MRILRLIGAGFLTWVLLADGAQAPRPRVFLLANPARTAGIPLCAAPRGPAKGLGSGTEPKAEAVPSQGCVRSLKDLRPALASRPVRPAGRAPVHGGLR